MKVKELIAKLSELDDDLQVVICRNKNGVFSPICDLELGSFHGESFFTDDGLDEDDDEPEIDAVWIY